MSDLKYVVDIELNIDEARVGSKVARVKDSFGPLAAEVGKIGGNLLDSFTGAVEKAGAVALTLGKIGAAAGIGAVTYGVVGLNQELETTQVSLAAVLNANQIGGGMNGAMSVAAGWVRQMRQDAKDLPGEFSDLLKIVQSGASAAFNAGLDVDKFEKLSAQGMAAAKAMSVPIDQAGRELAQLLEGRAGAHNVFGTRLGIHSSDFQGKTPEQRVELITAALNKFEPAIKTFGNTMDAQASTLVDNAKTFIGAATLPLFGKIKSTLVDVNAWFDANKSTVDLYAFKVGYALEQAFDKGKSVVTEYGPLLLDWGGRAYDKIVRIWQDSEPYVKEIGSEIKDFLSNDAGFDKIKTILELYIAAKGVSGTASVVSIVAPLVKAALPLLGVGAEASGGAGALGAAGAAGEGALAIGAGGAGAFAGLAAPLVAIAALIGKTVDEVISRQSLSRTVDHTGDAGFRSKDNQRYIDELGEKGKEAARRIADMDEATYAAALDLPPGFSAAADAAQDFASTIRALSKSGDFDKVGAMAQEALDAEFQAKQTKELEAQRTREFATSLMTKPVSVEEELAGGRVKDAMGGILNATTILVAQNLKADAAAKKKEQDARKAATHGTGGTTIHKVEISVSSNQNPGQIARTVGAYLSHASRFRTSSPYTRSFTSPGV